jgi:DNA-binding PadR family transcriptional regulator
MIEKKLVLGFIRVHILHHASETDGIYGSWMLKELEEHGYDISPGTLYPILHEMKEQSLLTVSEMVVGGKIRKIYRTTRKGDEVLSNMKKSIVELSREVLGQ